MSFDTTLVVALVFIAFMVVGVQCDASDDVSYNIDLMGPAIHHNEDPDVSNQNMRGIGLSATFSQKWTLGMMRYKNSYSNTTWAAGATYEFNPEEDFVYGVGAAAVTGYGDHISLPVLPYVTLRWGILQLKHIPGQVTALSAVIPFNDL